MGDDAMAHPAGDGDTGLRHRQALAFEHAPTSMWLQDLSLLKQRLDAWRGEGLTDLRACLANDAGRVEDLLGRVRLVAVNRETLLLYEVADEAELLATIRAIFGEDQIASFVEVICQLWGGALRTSVVTRNYTARGRPLDVNYKGRLLPGHEADWAAYLICVEDVTLQETALRDLEAARVHDPLTGLFNRAFLNDEMDRLEPSTDALALAVIDLNGLKAANDCFGHKAGDDLLSRMGDLLRSALPPSCSPVRLGGDEFVVILPGLPAPEVEALVSRLKEAADAEDAGPWSIPLSFSVGTAWRRSGESLDHLLARADRDMYEAKRAFHAKGPGTRSQAEEATG